MAKPNYSYEKRRREIEKKKKKEEKRKRKLDKDDDGNDIYGPDPDGEAGAEDSNATAGGEAV
ncbi:MAG: hypothetical protein ACAI44_10345 [Candidatus Sericytochromatia bacterium]